MYNEEYFRTLANGEEKMHYLKKCIAEADREKDTHNMIWLRHDYIEQSTFHDDGFKGLLMFPEFMKLFEENPGVMEPSSFMFPFKWILGRSSEYYQISLEQIDKYFEKFKEYIDKYGFTMRTYYRHKFIVYEDIDPDPEKLLGYMEESLKYERTQMSDCEACERNTQIRCEMKFGSEEKAIELLNDMLDCGMRCAEIPQCTYGELAYQFANKGMYDEALHYADLCLPMIKGDEMSYLNQISCIFIAFTMTDLNKAYELFRSTAHLYSLNKTPLVKFNYANAASRFFAKLHDAGEEMLHTDLNADFEMYSDSGEYDTAELRDFFANAAKDLAEKFDARNGNSCFSDVLAFEYPDAPVKELELPMHGKVQKSPFVVAVPFKTPESFPTPDELHNIFESLGEFKSTNIGFDKENNVIYLAGRDDEENVNEYRIVFNDMSDPSEMQQEHYLPKGASDVLGDYSCMMIIISVLKDNFLDMRRLVKLADAVNKDESPVIFDLVNNRILSSVWASLEASGTTAPYANYLYRVMVYRSAFADDIGDDVPRADITTVGLAECGSRNVLVPAVAEDDVEFVVRVVNQIASGTVAVSSLPDEGVAYNTGIYYDNRPVKVTWRPLALPFEEDDRVYAEPTLHMPDGRSLRPDELTEEERDQLNFYSSNRLSFISEAKARGTFDTAFKFYQRNAEEFYLVAGVEQTAVDEDGEEYDEVVYVQLRPDGSSQVLSEDNEALGIKRGDEYMLDPQRVFFWRLDIGEDQFKTDDLYFLLTKERELEQQGSEEE